MSESGSNPKSFTELGIDNDLFEDFDIDIDPAPLSEQKQDTESKIPSIDDKGADSAPDAFKEIGMDADLFSDLPKSPGQKSPDDGSKSHSESGGHSESSETGSADKDSDPFPESAQTGDEGISDKFSSGESEEIEDGYSHQERSVIIDASVDSSAEQTQESPGLHAYRDSDPFDIPVSDDPNLARTQAMPAVRSSVKSGGTGTLVFGTLSPGKAKLILKRGQGFKGAEYRLNAEEVHAGKMLGTIIFPDDPHMYDPHAVFMYEDGSLIVKDEGSESGTWIKIRESVPLQSFSEIAIGNTRLVFHGSLPDVSSGNPRPIGAPRPKNAIRIEERLTGNRPGRSWVCNSSIVRVGSGCECEILLDHDELADKEHALIHCNGPRKSLEDLDSEDGTFIRIEKGLKTVLKHGDRIRMGSQILEVSVSVSGDD